MSEFKRVKDRWKDLRLELNLFGNTEPNVELIAITTPVSTYDGDQYFFQNGEDDYVVSFRDIETLPAGAASTSYGSNINTTEKALTLNKKLVQMGHHVPLESIQLNLHISGLSKAGAAQLSRYRHTGHVSASRRFQQQKAAFVYPILDEFEDEDKARQVYRNLSENNKNCFEKYLYLRNVGASKEVARLCIPVASATERAWWCNIRELRHIINQRCRADTESEFRRLAFMMYDLVEPMMPSLFEDITTDMQND